MVDEWMGRARGERVMGKGVFKELRVWRKGKDLAVYIYRITRNIKYARKFKIDLGTLKDLSPLAIYLPFHPFPKDKMKLWIPKNRMEIKHFPKDLALVIFFTLLCVQTFL